MWIVFLLLCFLGPVSPIRRVRPRGRPFVGAPYLARRARTAEWVVAEIVRLKALMADAGCRRIADTFNRIHATRRKTTVSKTWVALTVRRQALQIEQRRREWKRRIPRPIPVNRVWGLDLTAKTDRDGTAQPILGIVDHGSRACVALRALPDKASITILRALIETLQRYGKPRAIRTDNEAVFTSRLFRSALALLRIRHQRTALHCPWQNGRVERFFRTLKEKLDRWAVDGTEQLELALGDFRTWYNHVRPHQHLGGATPAEAWVGIDPYVRIPVMPGRHSD